MSFIYLIVILFIVDNWYYLYSNYTYYAFTIQLIVDKIVIIEYLEIIVVIVIFY